VTKPPKQTAAQRAAAARATELQSAQQRRRATAITTAIVLAVVVVAVIAGVVAYKRGSTKPNSHFAIPSNATADGAVVGNASAKVTVDLYIDFQCPVCKRFETTTGPRLASLVDAGTIKIDYHPVAFLDRFSSTNYSTRSSEASGCAAQNGVFQKYVTLLYANQPPENGNGLPEETLIKLGEQAGAPQGFDSCVKSHPYSDWTKNVTDTASRKGINGTPTILVQGKSVGPQNSVPTADQVLAAISAAG
jgi:protein-disulfide isomerase